MDEKNEIKETVELNPDELEDVNGGFGHHHLFETKMTNHYCRKAYKTLEERFVVKKDGKRYCPFCHEEITDGQFGHPDRTRKSM